MLLLGVGVALISGWLLVVAPVAAVVLVSVLVVGIGGYLAARSSPSTGLVEIPVVLLLLSTLVLRGREASDLMSNPLDAAGIYRIVCVGLALGLSGIAWLFTTKRETSTGFRIYFLYVLSAVPGVILSIYPSLTGYRVVELVAAVLVLTVAWRLDAINRVLRVLFTFALALLAAVWVGVLAFPSEALVVTSGPLSFRLHGVLPAVSANDTGFLGVMVCLWCLCNRRPYIALFGALSVAASQYRTGYVALVVGVLILLMVKRSFKLPILIGVTSIACLLVFPSVLSGLYADAAQFALRGESPETITSLTGRTYWWDAALSVWEESWLLGKGLLTATRFEALAHLGFTATSTIHNAWIEALVGTGIVGLSLLAGSVLIVASQTLRIAIYEREPFPCVMLSVLLVRTVTGSSMEIFGFGALLYGCLALIGGEVARSERDAVGVLPARTAFRGVVPWVSRIDMDSAKENDGYRGLSIEERTIKK